MKAPFLHKLVILGGSSPFTIKLIDQFISNKFTQAFHLVLFGRNSLRLDLISSYSRHHLTEFGWFIETCTDLDKALDGARIIIHQSRYGGSAGRLEDEQFAKRFGFSSDENLGPCGLKSSIRMAPYLKILAKKIVHLCPDALVINLTNPLSIAVSILHFYGVKRIFGVCELPLTTFEKIAEIIGLSSDQIGWDYTGLNHRGFIYNLSFEGKDLFPEFLEKIKDSGFNGFDCSYIESLRAIPLKYLHLFSQSHHLEDRAVQVNLIGNKIIAELSLSPYESPSSLKDRDMSWYEKGIIPLLNALDSAYPKSLITNETNANGITFENKAFISKGVISTIQSQKAPANVLIWVRQFCKHEKAVLESALAPCPQNILEALQLDPLVQGAQLELIQQYLVNTYQKNRYANT